MSGPPISIAAGRIEDNDELLDVESTTEVPPERGSYQARLRAVRSSDVVLRLAASRLLELLDQLDHLDHRELLDHPKLQVASYVVSQSNGEFKLTGSPFSTGPYGIALPKGSGLAPLFLGAIKDLVKDGVYHAILVKWGTTIGAITNFVINGATS